MKKHTTARAVSFQGDEHDIAAINQLAKENGMKTGVFVATSLRKLHGKDLDRLASFFRKRASQTSHSASSDGNSVDHA